MNEKLMRMLDEQRMLRVQMTNAISDMPKDVAEKYKAVFEEFDLKIIEALKESRAEILKMYSQIAQEDSK